jgi:energy-converting hydrogenase Eha subunit E
MGKDLVFLQYNTLLSLLGISAIKESTCSFWFRYFELSDKSGKYS